MSLSIEDLPDELLVHVLGQLARDENVPGGLEEGEPDLRHGHDAVVLGPSSRAMRVRGNVGQVSRRWGALVRDVQPWRALERLAREDGSLDWDAVTVVPDDHGRSVWAATEADVVRWLCAEEWRTIALQPAGERVVVMIAAAEPPTNGVLVDAVRWLGCLQGMHHPCVAELKLVSVAPPRNEESNPRVCAAFEHADISLQGAIYGTLGKCREDGRPLPPSMLRSWMYQLLSALAYCHARGVAHGNIAPFRCLAQLVDNDVRELYRVKLAHFGFSMPLVAQQRKLPTRPSRAAPEIRDEVACKRSGPANDLWALGTVFAEAACGHGGLHWMDDPVIAMVHDLEQVSDARMASQLPMLGEEGRDLLRRMMRTDPLDRIAASEALFHPYFEGIHDECPVVARLLPRTAPPPPRLLELPPPRGWSPGEDFLVRQPQLNARRWSILVDWLGNVSATQLMRARTLHLAVDYLRRYLAVAAPVPRERLELIGIGALMLACKQDEIYVMDMEGFLYYGAGAFTLEQLLDFEVELLVTLDAQLHVPTAHDHLVPLLVSFGAAPSEALGCSEPWPTMRWCECLCHVGLIELPVVTRDPRILARVVATLGALLSVGVADQVRLPGGGGAQGRPDGMLHERACFLESDDDWSCLAELLDGLEKTALDDDCKLLARYTKLEWLSTVLGSFFSRMQPPPPHRLREGEARAYLERHYAPAYCDEQLHRSDRHARLRGKKSLVMHVFNVVSVTLAIGRQLLSEYSEWHEAAVPGRIL